MMDSSRCGSNRYVSERFNERRCNNERFGECREHKHGCGCEGSMNGRCCGWRPAPVRPIRPCGCRPRPCGCEEKECEEVNTCGIGSGCGCRPRPCPPRPCPPKPCPPRPCPPKPCRPCRPRPCRPCGCGHGRGPLYGEMEDYEYYDRYEGMGYMPEEYWDEEYEQDYEKEEVVEKEIKEEK